MLDSPDMCLSVSQEINKWETFMHLNIAIEIFLQVAGSLPLQRRRE